MLVKILPKNIVFMLFLKLSKIWNKLAPVRKIKKFVPQATDSSRNLPQYNVNALLLSEAFRTLSSIYLLKCFFEKIVKRPRALS